MDCLTSEECKQWRRVYARRHRCRRQQTFITPLRRLPSFTAALIELLEPFDCALLIVDEVVNDVSPALDSLRESAGEYRPMHEAPGHLFEHDAEGLRRALEATFSGCIDFRVLLSPGRHALRADHDEYTTVFAPSSSEIVHVRRILSRAGAKAVEYTADAP